MENSRTENDEITKASPRSRNTRKRKKTASMRVVFLSVILTALIVGVVSYVAAYRKAKSEFAHLRQPVVIEEGEALRTLRDNLQQGSGVTTALRRSIKDYLVLNLGDRYLFAPINYDLKMHKRTRENLKKDEPFWDYRENGRSVAEKGIDVSSHQGEIRWNEVKESGVEFAICRAVFRGYESGKLVVDECFARNAAGANENGIRLGAYLFSQAVNEEEMNEEIDLLLESVKPYQVEGPLVMDIELTEAGTGRADGLTVEERTALAKIFEKRIREAGYEPAFYYNYEAALTLIDITELEDSEKWYASYTEDFYYPYYYTFWQYSAKGKVNGIDSEVDLDLWFKD